MKNLSFYHTHVIGTPEIILRVNRIRCIIIEVYTRCSGVGIADEPVLSVITGIGIGDITEIGLWPALDGDAPEVVPEQVTGYDGILLAGSSASGETDAAATQVRITLCVVAVYLVITDQRVDIGAAVERYTIPVIFDDVSGNNRIYITDRQEADTTWIGGGAQDLVVDDLHCIWPVAGGAQIDLRHIGIDGIVSLEQAADDFRRVVDIRSTLYGSPLVIEKAAVCNYRAGPEKSDRSIAKSGGRQVIVVPEYTAVDPDIAIT